MSDGVFSKSLTRRIVMKSAAMAPAVVLLPTALRGASAQDKTTVTMVTDTAGLGDQSFNDLADKGGKKAAAELGIEWKVIESADASAYEPNLTAGAEQGQLTVAVGFLLNDALTTVAGQYPDKNFLHIDADSTAANILGTTFKENEPAFLAGVAAGLSTKSNKLGIVGGQRIPPVIRYEVGFVAGVKTSNPGAEISIVYLDTFGDAAAGQKTAADQFSLGADIVFPIAGLTGTGCYAAAKEKGAGFWIVSADTSQDQLAPGQELCVAQKGVDFAVYSGCKAVVDGTFKGGSQNLGLKEGGVSLQDPGHKLSAQVTAIAAAFQVQIIDGTLVVPVDDDTLKAFTAPALPDISATPAASPTS
jgi:basic membrane protein A